MWMTKCKIYQRMVQIRENCKMYLFVMLETIIYALNSNFPILRNLRLISLEKKSLPFVVCAPFFDEFKNRLYI